MSGKGKRFELDTKNAINRDTHDWVKAHRPDYSGSSVGEVADIMVVWQAERFDPQHPCGHAERHVVYGELKKRSGVDEGNRKVVMSGSSNGQSGLEELAELVDESPPWSGTYVGIKFQNRELIVIDACVLLHWLQRDKEGWGMEFIDRSVEQCKQHGARLTPSDNISMIKPELDDWPSSQSGLDDHIKFARSIGLDDYDFK